MLPRSNLAHSSGKHQRFSRWVRLRITRAGWLFCVLAVLVGLAAGQSQGALAFVLFGVMLGTLLLSGLISRRMVLAVAVGRDMADRAWQNQTMHLAYSLSNGTKRNACLGLRVEEAGAPGVESVGGFCLQLPPRAVFRAGARFAARRRGKVDLKGISVSTSFPFGLVDAIRTVECPRELVIWPALGQLKRRLLDRGAVETSSAAPSGATGGQDEFFGLREYREGDSPRWIHWRRSATRRVPVVREMARPLPEMLWLIVDTWMPDRFAATLARREKLLRFAATVVDYALARGYRVGLLICVGGQVRAISPSEGRGQRSDLLDALAEADDNLTVDLGALLAGMARGKLRQAQVLLVAPASEELRSAPLAGIRAEGRSLTIVTDEELPELFEDDPLVVAEGDDAV
jgi:uncharacterized protein (DUF58 family)